MNQCLMASEVGLWSVLVLKNQTTFAISFTTTDHDPFRALICKLDITSGPLFGSWLPGFETTPTNINMEEEKKRKVFFQKSPSAAEKMVSSCWIF